MSGIPYNRLQTVELTGETDNGKAVVIETLHYAFVVPCRDCKHYESSRWYESAIFPPLGTDIEHVCAFFADGVKVEPDGFCAWGERRGND